MTQKRRTLRHNNNNNNNDEDVSGKAIDGSMGVNATIEISVHEWARYNRLMIELLRALADAGSKKGLSTRKLHQKLSKTHNAQEIIKRAQQQGLIRRESKEPPRHKGSQLVVNYLTPKGKQLLDKLAR